MRIYVAGPLGPNNENRLPNVDKAILAGIAIADMGCSPFVPHLMHYFEGTGIAVLDYEDYMTIDFEWLAACDALLRLPGVSPGADREVAFAEVRDIPVFYSLESLLVHVRKDPTLTAERTKPSVRRAACTYEIEVFGEAKMVIEIMIGMFPSGRAAEVFVNAGTEGSDLHTIFSAWALTVSRALQWGTPLTEVAKAVKGIRDGKTRHMIHDGQKIECSSLWDAIGRVLEQHGR